MDFVYVAAMVLGVVLVAYRVYRGVKRKRAEPYATLIEQARKNPTPDAQWEDDKVATSIDHLLK